MSTTTANYNLIKPELSDAADITAYNGNLDKIDEQFKLNHDKFIQTDNGLNLANKIFVATTTDYNEYVIDDESIPELYEGLEINVKGLSSSVTSLTVNDHKCTIGYRSATGDLVNYSDKRTEIFTHHRSVKLRYNSKYDEWNFGLGFADESTFCGVLSPKNGGTGIQAYDLDDLKSQLGVTSLAEKITKLNEDYIYEQGYIDNWYYRKWAMGRCEAWKQITLNITTTLDTNEKFAGCTINDAIIFPDGVFVSTPMIQVTTIGGGYPCAILSSPNIEKCGLLIKTEWAVTNQTIFVNVYAFS